MSKLSDRRKAHAAAAEAIDHWVHSLACRAKSLGADGVASELAVIAHAHREAGAIEDGPGVDEHQSGDGKAAPKTLTREEIEEALEKGRRDAEAARKAMDRGGFIP